MKVKQRNILLGIIDTIVYIALYLFMALVITAPETNKVFCNTWFLPALVLGSMVKTAINICLGLYKRIYEYRGKRDIMYMGFVSGISSLFVLIVFVVLELTQVNPLLLNVQFATWPIEIFYVLLARICTAYWIELRKRAKVKLPTEIKRTLIIGAGSSGQIVFDEILHHNTKGLKVVGFVDDDPEKIGMYFCNEKVYGPISDINKIKNKLNVDQILICCPSAGPEKIKEISNLIDYKDTNVLVMPEVTKMLSSDITPRLRKVSISDLLGRKQIELDKTQLSEFLCGKVVMVTGGGGSIGSEIARQVISYGPSKLIIFDIYENTTYELFHELRSKYMQMGVEMPETHALIGSIRDEKRLEEVFSTYKPNIVFHAAAHKHVPLMEDSPKEAIKNNVVGTYNVAKTAMKYGVDKMVMISTDKAVNPTNVMGASKRFCEMIVEAFDNMSTHTRYSMVRFGNVLGSHGSVIPLFERQLAEGGPLTVTHEEINRFFMTIPEACSLVIQSGVYAKGGEKFILDMGEPVKIIDLARNMIKLSGLVEGEDISIKVTGLRPGEKLYEELLLDKSKAQKTQNEKIFVEKSNHPFTLEEIDKIIADLKEIAEEENNKKILDYLKKMEEIKGDESAIIHR